MGINHSEVHLTYLSVVYFKVYGFLFYEVLVHVSIIKPMVEFVTTICSLLALEKNSINSWRRALSIAVRTEDSFPRISAVGNTGGRR